jgi:hypothetical protein
MPHTNSLARDVDIQRAALTSEAIRARQREALERRNEQRMFDQAKIEEQRKVIFHSLMLYSWGRNTLMLGFRCAFIWKKNVDSEPQQRLLKCKQKSKHY